MITKKLALIPLLAAFFACSHSPSARGPAQLAPPFSLSAECQEFIQSLPASIDYGWVSAPENEGRQDLPPVYTFYYQRRMPGQIPIAYFNGGPGQDMHTTAFGLLADLDKKLAAPLWIVFIDQRGNGCSSPYPVNRPTKDLLFWGTQGIARDADEIRKHLGFPQWHLFGQSYGGMILQRYLEMFPEHVLKAVSASGATVSAPEDLMRLRVEQQVYTVRDFILDRPKRADRIVDIVRNRKCGSMGCGAEFIASAVRERVGNHHGWAVADVLMGEAARSTTSAPLRNPEAYVAPHPGWIVNVADTGIFQWADCAKVQRLYLRTFGTPEIFALSECWGFQANDEIKPTDFQRFKQQMKDFNIPYIDNAKIRKNLSQYPEIDLRLFSSEWDYFLPDAIISRAAGEMGPRAKFKRLLKTSHEAFADDYLSEVFSIFSEKH